MVAPNSKLKANRTMEYKVVEAFGLTHAKFETRAEAQAFMEQLKRNNLDAIEQLMFENDTLKIEVE